MVKMPWIKKKRPKEDSTIADLPEIWDEYAKIYDKTFAKFGVYKMFTRALEKSLPHRSGGVILDGGCGTGQQFETIIRNLQPEHLVGMDNSLRMLLKAKRVARSLSQDSSDCKIEMVRADICEGLPFPDNYFDGQIYQLVWYYLPANETRKVLQEVYRVAKPGGFVIATNAVREFDFKKEVGPSFLIKEAISNPWGVLLSILGRKRTVFKFQELARKGALEYLSEEEWVSMQRAAGFEKIEVCERTLRGLIITTRAFK